MQVGVNYYHLKQYKKARAAYARALSISPRFPLALYNMAVLYDAGLRDFRLAKRYYEQFMAAAKTDPSHVELMHQAAKRIKDLEGWTRAK